MDRKIRLSRKQEDRGAANFGGTRNAGSGNGLRKNDVRTREVSIEYKRTDNKQYTIKLKELLDAERNALLDGRDIVFGIEMGNRNWILIPEEDYLTLRRVW